MASETRKIGTAEWESYKHSIIHLRHNGFTLEEIMEKMKRDCGFVATRSQFETQLHRWGERKNLSKKHWRLVIRLIDQYLEDGIDCNVMMNNRAIPERKLQRQRNDLRGDEEYRKLCQTRVSRNQLPRNVEVRSSKPSNSLPEMGQVNDHEQVPESSFCNPPIKMSEPTSFAATFCENEISNPRDATLYSKNQMNGPDQLFPDHVLVNHTLSTSMGGYKGFESPFPGHLGALYSPLNSPLHPAIEAKTAPIQPLRTTGNQIKLPEDVGSPNAMLSAETSHSTFNIHSSARNHQASDTPALQEPDISVADGFYINMGHELI